MTDSRIIWPHLHDREQFQRMYDDLHRGPTYDWRRWRFEWMREFAPKPGSSILDLGCSSGRNVLHYARLGHLTKGVECSLEACAQFWQMFFQEPIAIQNGCDAIWPSFIEDYEPLKEWDNVLLTEVLEHVTDPVPVLKVARQALATDGEVYVSAPTYHEPLNPEHVRGVTEGPLRHWCGQAGLEVFYVNQGRRRIVAKLRRVKA